MKQTLIPVSRGKCDHGLCRDQKNNRKKCDERAELGFMLCPKHRAEGLARVAAMLDKKRA